MSRAKLTLMLGVFLGLASPALFAGITDRAVREIVGPGSCTDIGRAESWPTVNPRYLQIARNTELNALIANLLEVDVVNGRKTFQGYNPNRFDLKDAKESAGDGLEGFKQPGVKFKTLIQPAAIYRTLRRVLSDQANAEKLIAAVEAANESGMLHAVIYYGIVSVKEGTDYTDNPHLIDVYLNASWNRGKVVRILINE